MAYWSLIIAN